MVIRVVAVGQALRSFTKNKVQHRQIQTIDTVAVAVKFLNWMNMMRNALIVAIITQKVPVFEEVIKPFTFKLEY